MYVCANNSETNVHHTNISIDRLTFDNRSAWMVGVEGRGAIQVPLYEGHSLSIGASDTPMPAVRWAIYRPAVSPFIELFPIRGASGSTVYNFYRESSNEDRSREAAVRRDHSRQPASTPATLAVKGSLPLEIFW